MPHAVARLGRRMPQMARAHARRLRLVFGLALSVAFLAVTVSGTDLALVGRIIVAASPIGVLAALAFVAVDVAIRAYRWRVLLGGIARVTYRRALGFLCIGYFANTLLPARLGDVARAYLAGNAFGAPRLATLGTIGIERVSDGLVMLATVIVAGAFVPDGGAIRGTAIALALVGLAGLVVVAVGVLAARRTGLDTTHAGRLVGDLVQRVIAGAAALRTPGGAFRVVAATAAGLVTAILIVTAVAAATGIGLSPLGAAVLAAGLALSLAIPAAPGSVGTYEFVGVSILVGLGHPPEAALATVVLVHAVAALPPALAGLVSLWALQLRVSTIVESSDEGTAAT